MMKSAKTLSLFVMMIGCATNDPTPPCYEGWTSNESGSSKIWTPNSTQGKLFEFYVPDGHKIHCFHRTADLKITAITESEKKLYYFEFEPIGEEFKIIDDGIISTHN